MCNMLLFSIFVASYCTAAANCMKASSYEAKLKFHLIMSTPILLTANGTAFNLCSWLCRVSDLLLSMIGFSLNSLDLTIKLGMIQRIKCCTAKWPFWFTLQYCFDAAPVMCDSITISLNFLSVTAVGFSILPDSTVIYYDIQPTSC